MIRYLVDTNVLSARREPALSAWLDAASPGLYLSAVTIAEIATAATAVSQDLVLLTRNTRHFKPLGIRLVDPFDALPPL